MKTIYDGLHGRIEISDGLLDKVDAAASEVKQRFDEHGKRIIVELPMGRRGQK